MGLINWQELYAQAAAELGFGGDGLDANGNCTLVLSHPGMPPISMVYDAIGDMVDVVAEIGHVPFDDAELYREFLADNSTSEAVFALRPDTGKVMLRRALAMNVLEANPGMLVAALTNFAETVYQARRRLYRRATGANDNGEMRVASGIFA